MAKVSFYWTNYTTGGFQSVPNLPTIQGGPTSSYYYPYYAEDILERQL
jgi:hypothetical protein